MYSETVNSNIVSSTYPFGSILAYLGSSDPSGWVIADGFERVNTSGLYNRLIQNGIGTAKTSLSSSYQFVKVTFKSKFATNTSKRLVLGRMFFFGSADISTIILPYVDYEYFNGFMNRTNTWGPTTIVYGVTNGVPSLIKAPEIGAYISTDSNGEDIIDGFNITIILSFQSIVPIRGYALFSNHVGTNSSYGYQSNPKSWSVSGSKYGIKWEEIDSVTLSTQPTSNSSLMYWTSTSDSTDSLYKKMIVDSEYVSIYNPPNLKAAFLRGTGTSGVYSGPNLKEFQGHATQTHNHTVNDPKHSHLEFTYVEGPDSGFNRNRTAYTQGRRGFISYTSIYSNTTGITTLNETSDTVVNSINRYTDPNETRPYNYGVNWIIKL